MNSSSTSQKNSLPFSCENHDIQVVSSDTSESIDPGDDTSPLGPAAFDDIGLENDYNKKRCWNDNGRGQRQQKL